MEFTASEGKSTIPARHVGYAHPSEETRTGERAQAVKSVACNAHSLVQALAQLWLCSVGTLSDNLWGWQGLAQAVTTASRQFAYGPPALEV